MRQLSGMDAAFLNMETRSTFGHVSSLNLFDVSGLADDSFFEGTRRLVEDRLGLLPPFRRRLVEVPLGLDLPYWIEDPDFDLDFHVRHHAVPAPGTPQQLSDVISRIHARPLDRTRPLWELYVIDGVDGGRMAATFTKVHHATIDGASGAMMLANLLDVDPAGSPTPEVDPWTPDAVPSDRQLIERTMLEYIRRPEKFIRLSVRALRELSTATRNGGLRVMADLLAQPVPGPVGNVMRRRLRGVDNEVDNPPALPATAAPRTPWNASIGAHRRFAYTTVPLADAKSVRHAVGCTFNDVVMALCSGTLRRYLTKHDCLPDEPLVAMVPVSVRTGAEEDTFQNRVSALFADLATNEPDPRRRLIAAEGDDGSSEDRLPGDPGRHVAGLHPVRPARDRRQGDAHVQPPAHRRPHGAAVQPGDLQRARTELSAVRRGRQAAALLPRVGDRRWRGPQHHRAELQRQPRLRLRLRS